MHEDTPSDDLATLVRTFQWENWRELRFADLGSEEYRRGVARLAQRLVEANRKVEEVDVAAAALELQPSAEADVDDSPGFIDQLAAAEEALPQWRGALELHCQGDGEVGGGDRGGPTDLVEGDAPWK